MTAIAEPTPVHASEIAFTSLASDETVERTAAAMRARGFDVHVVDGRDEARDLIIGMVPEGAEVGSGASVTLDELGVRAEIEGSGRYDALRPRLRSMDRATHGREIRKLGASPDFWLNSANALTEDGRLVFASFGGSQIGPIASGAGRVILALGTQKIVADLDAAFRRIEEYVLPLEDARLVEAYRIHTAINKVLLLNGDRPGRTSVVLVREAVGN
jgi:hypothetical protein